MANNFGRVNVSITASTGGLTAGLSRASGQLRGFATDARKQTGGLGGLFSDAARNALGLGRASSLASVGVSALSVAMRSLLLPLGIVAAIAAPFAAFAAAATAAEQLHNLSQETGIAVADLQVMTQVADEFGVSQQQMTTGLRRTARMVGELGQGTPSAVKAFGQLGLTMQDLAGMSTADQFALISQRIAALPPAMQAAAAVDIFGRSGQSMLNFIRGAGEASAEVKRLQQALGVTLSDQQTAAIEGMGDAIKRLGMPIQGFINQFLAELSPAITAVSNLIVAFFAENAKGWSMAKMLADGLVVSIRMVVGAMTLLTGIFQVFQAAGSQLGQMFSEVFSVILGGVANVMKSMARLAEASGFTDLADSLSGGAQGASQIAQGAAEMGDMYGQAAADGFANAMENIGNPFGAFDREFAKAQQAAQDSAAARAGADAGAAAGQGVAAAIGASTQSLRAVVVGSSEGESLRASIARGADPRLEGGNDAKRTADNTERTADGIDELVATMGDSGFGQVEIAVA